MKMKRRDAGTMSLDGNGILPTQVKNFTPARADGKAAPLDTPVTPEPLPRRDTQRYNDHRTSASHIERNTTNNAIRHQPLKEAQAMMPVVKWLAAPAGVFAFCVSFVKDFNDFFVHPGLRWYTLKSIAVHLMVACAVSLIVGIVVFVVVWRYTSVGVGRTKIAEEQKTERQRLKSQERIQRARATAEAKEATLRIQAAERQHMAHMDVLRHSVVERNQPFDLNQLTTYRQQPQPEGVTDAPYLDPVGVSILEFTAKCYAQSQDGEYIHVDARGYVRKAVSIPWTVRGKLTRPETRAALGVFDSIRPKLWAYDKARKMWCLNLAAYPTLDLALAALNSAPTRKVY